MWVAGRSDFKALFCLLTGQQGANTRVILRKEKRTTAIDYTPIEKNIVRSPHNTWLNLKEGARSESPSEGSKLEEQEDMREKEMSGRQRWAAEKLGENLPNWPTVTPGPGHF